MQEQAIDLRQGFESRELRPQPVGHDVERSRQIGEFVVAVEFDRT
jgi:hypothetical protein